MAERNLYGSYTLKGVTYGPGKAEMPDDMSDTAKQRIDSLEKAAEARFKDQVQATVGNLPPGHPFERMFSAMAQENPIASALAGDNYISQPDRSGTDAESDLDETDVGARTASWSRTVEEDAAPKTPPPPKPPASGSASANSGGTTTT